MNKYIAEVTRACKAEAYKGHSHAKVYLFDCLSIPEEVEQEVEPEAVQYRAGTEDAGNGMTFSLGSLH